MDIIKKFNPYGDVISEIHKPSGIGTIKDGAVCHAIDISRDRDTAYADSVPRNNKKRIEIKSYHLSCQSDVSYNSRSSWDVKNLGGIIVYSVGTLNVSVRIKPGYVYIKNTDKIDSKWGDEGMVHGALCRLLLGYQPSEVQNAGGCLSGFAIVNGVIKYNSYSTNASGGYSDGTKPMNDIEAKMLRNAIELWKSGTAGQNIYVKDL